MRGENCTVEKLGAKMDALGLWEALAPYNWSVKPRGTAFPYFCLLLKGDGKPVKVRLLMLEGWQTLHDFLHARADRDFGFYSAPIEFPHLELVVLASGESKLFRHDTGYMPVEASESQRALGLRILWETYGVMLRLESEPKLPLQFAGEQALFARVEGLDGKWSDAPLPIPSPRPRVEKVTFEKADLQRARDLPLVAGDALELDFRLLPNVMTRDAMRPRCVYALQAVDRATGAKAIDCRASVSPDVGLKELWESLPSQVLKALIARGRVPGELCLRTKRVFRLLRPLCLELSLKLSLHDRLPALEASFGHVT